MNSNSMKLILLARTFLIEKDIPMDDSVQLQLTDDKKAIRVWDQQAFTFDCLIDLSGKVSAI